MRGPCHINLVNEFKANASWNSQRIPPIGEDWKRETYGFTFPQLFADGGRFENSIPDTTIPALRASTASPDRSISPTTDIQFSRQPELVEGRTHAQVRRHGDTQPQGSERPIAVRGAARVQPGRAIPRPPATRLRTPCLAISGPIRKRPTIRSGCSGSGRPKAFVSDNWRVSSNLSLEAGLRYTWHQPIYTGLEQHGELRPVALRSQPSGDRESQRHARTRLRRSFQRDDSRRRRRSGSRARPRP